MNRTGTKPNETYRAEPDLCCWSCVVNVRVNPLAEATRVQLDNDYMLLLWRHDGKPKRICDLFWVKKSRYAVGSYCCCGGSSIGGSGSV